MILQKNETPSPCNQEQRILRQMRKILGNVVKDVTPLGGRSNPLSDNTLQNFEPCTSLLEGISVLLHSLFRERFMWPQ